MYVTLMFIYLWCANCLDSLSHNTVWYIALSLKGKLIDNIYMYFRFQILRNVYFMQVIYFAQLSEKDRNHFLTNKMNAVSKSKLSAELCLWC